MMNTAGQMMNAMNQVTGIVKQVGGFLVSNVGGLSIKALDRKSRTRQISLE